jgi:DNA-binding transcriptional MerR regulator
MNLVLAFSALFLISSSVSSLEQADAIAQKQSDVEHIASWLAREQGLPLKDVHQALNSPTREYEPLKSEDVQKREDKEQEVAEESIDDNAIETDNRLGMSNAGNTSEREGVNEEDQIPTEEGSPEVAEESVDEDALESDDADDIEKNAEEKTHLSKRGFSGCGCGCVCRPKKFIKSCIVRPARRFTVIHQTDCIQRFVPRVRVAKVYRKVGGHCGCHRPVCIGKLIVVDRGCRVDVFLRTTRRSNIVKAPFLLKTKHRFTTCRFNHWNTQQGFLGHHSFGCGCRHGGCRRSFGYGQGLGGGEFALGKFYNQKHF